ncbi:tyrosine-type recombinase/integrase [Herbiconiux ginsengi]|uniref:Site-specific recombinase XerD n=1 Tax=Herbiconiux ginsengi TaxID=381665 RepID=A0A1H3PNG4_9MICO|nr:site-specific integrase [Herbiconiux ginsengi]SDZ02568.1 Site-specific recombinase XerD [Herbiconiux ginsengi]
MSIRQRPDGSWRARFRDADGKEHARHFKYKNNPRHPEDSAQHWLDHVTTSVVTGTYVDPKLAKLTVGEWCDTWLSAYEQNRASSVRQARSHVKHIKTAFGSRQLRDVRPSDVKAWTAALKASGLADSTVYALHSRLSHIFTDAVHDGLVPRSPVSRRTSPGQAKQRMYVATTEQVWELHERMPAHFKPVILLGAFAGLRIGEIAALRTSDVDFLRGIITPEVQYPALPLKTETSKTPIPIPLDLCTELSRVPAKWGSATLVVGAFGRPVSPYTIETAFRKVADSIKGLPAGFRIQDLRHYFASFLIASNMDIKTVQKLLRHASAKVTLDTYGHMWPDKEESARAAIAKTMATRADFLRTRGVETPGIPRDLATRRSTARTRRGAGAGRSA